MKILLLPKYHAEGASSRYRLYNYIKYFEKRGHSVDVKPLLFDGYVKNLYARRENSQFDIVRDILKRMLFLLGNKKKYEMLIIEKELFTNVPYFVEGIILKGVNYALDYDDAISINYKKSRLKRLFFKRKIDNLTNRASVVTVGNKWYWNELKCAKLWYLPTVVDLEAYNLLDVEKVQKSTLIIVWIGSPSTVHYLKTIAGALKKLSKKHDFILRVIGADISLEGVRVECVKWSQETEFKLIQESDIGIMPLLDTIWEKGKCGFKLIQYMASGLPTVSSPEPANEEITVKGRTGFIASNEDEWVKYMSILLEDRGIRDKMGLEARRRVEENYSYQVWGNKLVSLIESFNS
ncbi:MAG TPA: glycosyltransferase family 4 protein [Pseudobacteroides sp.]|uniref:glycosyltransferase family 4 protein n=1 Tax=Pseudobacteroides sp. TaxID=1968840 RepID=UPI002F936A93